MHRGTLFLSLVLRFFLSSLTESTVFEIDGNLEGNDGSGFGASRVISVVRIDPCNRTVCRNLSISNPTIHCKFGEPPFEYLNGTLMLKQLITVKSVETDQP